MESIAHYRIGAKIGEGGMGAVYRATDTRLSREVAVKVLPKSFASDSNRLARFAREAHVLASLNHPNIASIYGVEEGALVLELVEGPTLADRISQGPLPLDEALPLARDMAAALEYAHDHGVIHRDLKPANIKVTPEGRVKILDFGLAKAMTGDSAGGDSAASPTLTMGVSHAGAILGTAGYMAPEQAKGKPVDRRADIWAFGVVLCELLSGKAMYKGETVSETLAAVLMTEPVLPEGLPQPLRRLLERCLNKDPLRRLRDIGEARIALDDMIAGKVEPAVDSAAGPAAAAPRTPRLAWAVASLFALVAAGLGWAWYKRAPQPQPVVRFTIPPPEGGRFYTLLGMALSPDGRHLAFISDGGGSQRLWVRDLESLEPRSLPGTEEARVPFWSVDNRQVGYFQNGKLKRASLPAGPAAALADAPNVRGASWNELGGVLFTPTATSPLEYIPSGGARETVTALAREEGETSHRWPWFLPSGRKFLYTARNATPAKSAVYLAELGSTERQLVLNSHAQAAFVPPGYLLFMNQQTLMGQRFEPSSGKLSGEPAVIAQQVGWSTFNVQASYAASGNGVLAYIPGSDDGSMEAVWMDSEGKATPAIGKVDPQSRIAVSPDGKMIATTLAGPQSTMEIRLFDSVRGTASRFTDGRGDFLFPVWSPDGRCLAYSNGNTGKGWTIVTKPVSGGQEWPVSSDKSMLIVHDWSADGRRLLYSLRSMDPEAAGLWVQPMKPKPGACPVPDGAAKRYLALSLESITSTSRARFSPDSRWVAYDTNEAGRPEPVIQSFPDPSVKLALSSGQGVTPAWSRDGKFAYYLDALRRLVQVPIERGEQGRLVLGRPRMMFSPAVTGGFAEYDLSPDGRRFLVCRSNTSVQAASVTIVQNWPALLDQR